MAEQTFKSPGFFEKEIDLKDIVSKDTPNFLECDNLLKIKSNYVDFDKSIEILKDKCYVKEVTKDTFMEEIVKYIGLDESHYGDVKDCYESKNYTYQIMYKMTNNEDNIAILYSLCHRL